MIIFDFFLSLSLLINKCYLHKYKNMFICVNQTISSFFFSFNNRLLIKYIIIFNNLQAIFNFITQTTTTKTYFKNSCLFSLSSYLYQFFTAQRIFIYIYGDLILNKSLLLLFFVVIVVAFLIVFIFNMISRFFILYLTVYPCMLIIFSNFDFKLYTDAQNNI